MTLMKSFGFSFIGLTLLVVTPFNFGAAPLEPVTLEVIKAALDILSYQYPQAKDTDPNLIIDTAIMKRIEQSGLMKALYKK